MSAWARIIIEKDIKSPICKKEDIITRLKCSILFLGKEKDDHVEKALDFCKLNFTDVTANLGKWGDPLPEEIQMWEGEYIISYLSRWVISVNLLKKAKIAAINFHPASPDYPGFGCNNFALYEEAREFGVTCHYMAPRVDTGAIIAVKRFPVFSTDNVASLLERTYNCQLALFYEIVSLIIEGKELPISEERWTRKPFNRKDFENLEQITPDMTNDEIAKRIRATTFGKWKPYIDLHGFIFELKTGKDES